MNAPSDHYSYSPWRRRFALFPVACEGRIAWLRFVERRTRTLDYYGHHFVDAEYREIASTGIGGAA